jgi:hypothetical protein
MNKTRLSHPDPFATLVQLTAGALSRPALNAATPRVPATEQAHSLFDRLDTWLWRARQRDLERSLAGATDAVDLEQRLAKRIGVFGRYV